MLTYNTQLKKLVLPEYGRNIQQMVDHCLTIQDRDERTRCAYSIINIMGNLFPNLRDVEDFRHKLWDHLAIMADFKLDIDFPYETISADNLKTLPSKVEYTSSQSILRHYGKYIELMILKASTMDDGEEKNILLSMIANHMKKIMISANADSVDDEKILHDLFYYSQGKINLNPNEFKLCDFKAEQPNQANKKKKKK